MAGQDAFSLWWVFHSIPMDFFYLTFNGSLLTN